MASNYAQSDPWRRTLYAALSWDSRLPTPILLLSGPFHIIRCLFLGLTLPLLTSPGSFDTLSWVGAVSSSISGWRIDAVLGPSSYFDTMARVFIVALVYLLGALCLFISARRGLSQPLSRQSTWVTLTRRHVAFSKLWSSLGMIIVRIFFLQVYGPIVRLLRCDGPDAAAGVTWANVVATQGKWAALQRSFVHEAMGGSCWDSAHLQWAIPGALLMVLLPLVCAVHMLALSHRRAGDGDTQTKYIATLDVAELFGMAFLQVWMNIVVDLVPRTVYLGGVAVMSMVYGYVVHRHCMYESSTMNSVVLVLPAAYVWSALTGLVGDYAPGVDLLNFLLLGLTVSIIAGVVSSRAQYAVIVSSPLRTLSNATQVHLWSSHRLAQATILAADQRGMGDAVRSLRAAVLMSATGLQSSTSQTSQASLGMLIARVHSLQPALTSADASPAQQLQRQQLQQQSLYVEGLESMLEQSSSSSTAHVLQLLLVAERGCQHMIATWPQSAISHLLAVSFYSHPLVRVDRYVQQRELAAAYRHSIIPAVKCQVELFTWQHLVRTQRLLSQGASSSALSNLAVVQAVGGGADSSAVGGGHASAGGLGAASAALTSSGGLEGQFGTGHGGAGIGEHGVSASKWGVGVPTQLGLLPEGSIAWSTGSAVLSFRRAVLDQAVCLARNHIAKLHSSTRRVWDALIEVTEDSDAAGANAFAGLPIAGDEGHESDMTDDASAVITARTKATEREDAVRTALLGGRSAAAALQRLDRKNRGDWGSLAIQVSENYLLATRALRLALRLNSRCTAALTTLAHLLTVHDFDEASGVLLTGRADGASDTNSEHSNIRLGMVHSLMFRGDEVLAAHAQRLSKAGGHVSTADATAGALSDGAGAMQIRIAPDAPPVILGMNREVELMLGCSAESLAGAPLAALFPGLLREALNDMRLVDNAMSAAAFMILGQPMLTMVVAKSGDVVPVVAILREAVGAIGQAPDPGYELCLRRVLLRGERAQVLGLRQDADVEGAGRSSCARSGTGNSDVPSASLLGSEPPAGSWAGSEPQSVFTTGSGSTDAGHALVPTDAAWAAFAQMRAGGTTVNEVQAVLERMNSDAASDDIHAALSKAGLQRISSSQLPQQVHAVMIVHGRLVPGEGAGPAQVTAASAAAVAAAGLFSRNDGSLNSTDAEEARALLGNPAPSSSSSSDGSDGGGNSAALGWEWSIAHASPGLWSLALQLAKSQNTLVSNAHDAAKAHMAWRGLPLHTLLAASQSGVAGGAQSGTSAAATANRPTPASAEAGPLSEGTVLDFGSALAIGEPKAKRRGMLSASNAVWVHELHAQGKVLGVRPAYTEQLMQLLQSFGLRSQLGPEQQTWIVDVQLKCKKQVKQAAPGGLTALQALGPRAGGASSAMSDAGSSMIGMQALGVGKLASRGGPLQQLALEPGDEDSLDGTADESSDLDSTGPAETAHSTQLSRPGLGRGASSRGLGLRAAGGGRGQSSVAGTSIAHSGVGTSAVVLRKLESLRRHRGQGLRTWSWCLLCFATLCLGVAVVTSYTVWTHYFVFAKLQTVLPNLDAWNQGSAYAVTAHEELREALNGTLAGWAQRDICVHMDDGVLGAHLALQYMRDGRAAAVRSWYALQSVSFSSISSSSASLPAQLPALAVTLRDGEGSSTLLDSSMAALLRPLGSRQFSLPGSFLHGQLKQITALEQAVWQFQDVLDVLLTRSSVLNHENAVQTAQAASELVPQLDQLVPQLPMLAAALGTGDVPRIRGALAALLPMSVDDWEDGRITPVATMLVSTMHSEQPVDGLRQLIGRIIFNFQPDSLQMWDGGYAWGQLTESSQYIQDVAVQLALATNSSGVASAFLPMLALFMPTTFTLRTGPTLANTWQGAAFVDAVSTITHYNSSMLRTINTTLLPAIWTDLWFAESGQLLAGSRRLTEWLLPFVFILSCFALWGLSRRHTVLSLASYTALGSLPQPDKVALRDFAAQQEATVESLSSARWRAQKLSPKADTLRQHSQAPPPATLRGATESPKAGSGKLSFGASVRVLSNSRRNLEHSAGPGMSEATVPRMPSQRRAARARTTSSRLTRCARWKFMLLGPAVPSWLVSPDTRKHLITAMLVGMLPALVLGPLTAAIGVTSKQLTQAEAAITKQFTMVHNLRMASLGARSSTLEMMEATNAQAAAASMRAAQAAIDQLVLAEHALNFGGQFDADIFTRSVLDSGSRFLGDVPPLTMGSDLSELLHVNACAIMPADLRDSSAWGVQIMPWRVQQQQAVRAVLNASSSSPVCADFRTLVYAKNGSPASNALHSSLVHMRTCNSAAGGLLQQGLAPALQRYTGQLRAAVLTMHSYWADGHAAQVEANLSASATAFERATAHAAAATAMTIAQGDMLRSALSLESNHIRHILSGMHTAALATAVQAAHDHWDTMLLACLLPLGVFLVLYFAGLATFASAWSVANNDMHSLLVLVPPSMALRSASVRTLLKLRD